MKSKSIKIILSLVTLYALFGFFVLPMIVKSQVEKNLNALLIPKTSLEKVIFNPFTMQIKLQNFSIHDEKSSYITFKELYVDFSILKSIHKTHVSFKQVKLSDLYVNIQQNSDGSINLISLMKEQDKAPTKKEGSTSKEQNTLPFKISKTVLDNAHINMKLNNGDNPIVVNLKNLNYTFYELGTYKNALASHSLKTTINKSTKLNIDGGFNLIPFKMYGKINLQNLKTNDYLPYSSELLKFDISDATVDMNLGYQIDLSKEFTLRISDANLAIKDVQLLQNEQTFTSLKSLEVNNFNLLYPQQEVSIQAININDFFAKAMIDKKGNLNFANLIKNQNGQRVEKIKEKRKEGKDIWNLKLQDININNALAQVQDKQNQTNINTKDIDINLNDISLIGTKLQLNKASINVAKIDLKDNKNKTSIKSNKFALQINTIKKNQESINIQKINLKQPYTQINNKEAKITAKNLNLNIYNIFTKDNYLKVKRSILNNPKLAITVKKKAEQNKKTVQNKPTKQAKTETFSKKPAFNLDLGPFDIKKANIIFEDKNLPIPFKTNISKLNGNFSELITKSTKPTKLKLEGQVDKYGYTKITGFVDHKNIKNLTDVQLLFKNIAIKNFTPYSGKFVGRELDGGKLNLNLKYNITKSNIDAKNSIIITDIKLGNQIKSPGAMSLPLELAIALMEDSNGVIDLNIPISGNVDDPKFSIAPIVWKAFSNLIIKAVTSPFRFLASLFDFDEEELKSVEYAFGDKVLIASEKETLDKIAQIFAKRPNIALKVQPSFHSILDTKALQQQKFEQLINKEIKTIKQAEDKYLAALEQTYTNYKGLTPLKELKKEFANTKQNKQKKTKEKKELLDKEAYAAHLKEIIVNKQMIQTEELQFLAKQRAQAISDYLKTTYKIDETRVLINEKTVDDTKSKEWVAFKLEIGLKAK